MNYYTNKPWIGYFSGCCSGYVLHQNGCTDFDQVSEEVRSWAKGREDYNYPNVLVTHTNNPDLKAHLECMGFKQFRFHNGNSYLSLRSDEYEGDCNG
jgi:hypothetical protein